MARRAMVVMALAGLAGCYSPSRDVPSSHGRSLEPGGSVYCLEDEKGVSYGWPARANGMCYEADRPVVIREPAPKPKGKI